MNTENTPNSESINMLEELTDLYCQIIADASQCATKAALEGARFLNPYSEGLPREIWNATYDNTILTIEEALPKVRLIGQINAAKLCPSVVYDGEKA